MSSPRFLTLRGPLAALVLVAASLGGCAPHLATPFAVEPPRHAPPQTTSHDLVAAVPAPADPVVVAVYRFRDQTGQYRALENVSTFSTSVTQGATSILIGTLEDSGFFVPIEREGLSNLLNERQIISSTRQQYSGPEGEGLGPLPPLLYAGVLLEGGVIGYDSNVMTGGAGARLLGVGAAGQYRQDQVTVYLRAVSVQTGRVLKSVQATKTIVSQKLDGGAFLFVDTDALLETEAGYSTNEPPVLAVTAAIEAAVVSLVVEGARNGLWAFAAPQAPETRDFIAAYEARVATDGRRDPFGRVPVAIADETVSLAVSTGLADFQTDYAEGGAQPTAGVRVMVPVRRGLSAGLRTEAGFLTVDGRGEPFGAVAAVSTLEAFPTARVSPTLTLGGGVISAQIPNAVNTFAFGTAALGLEARLRPSVTLFAEAGVDYPLREGLDGIRGSGGVHDNLWVGRAGVSIGLPR